MKVGIFAPGRMVTGDGKEEDGKKEEENFRNHILT
jgi:hypothetical protein